MSVTVKWIDKTGAARDAVDDAIAGALEAVGVLVEGDAKLNIRAYPAIKTGNLIGSINHKTEKDSVTIGTNVEYAPMVEFGTSRMRPRPYLTRALDEGRGRIQRLFSEFIEARLRR